jgi:hypothetical protein
MATPSDSSARQSAAIKSIEIRLWAKRIAYAILAVIIIALSAGQLKSCSKTGGDAYGWTLMEVISCPMGEESWKQNFGWCKSQSVYKPGTYRIIVREAHWEHALWNPEGTAVVGYMPIPAQGVWLSSWQDTPFERKFLQEAPLGGNRRLGSLIAKIGEGKPFEALHKGSFEIEEKETLSISVNLPSGKDFFAYNRGVIKVEVEREID